MLIKDVYTQKISVPSLIYLDNAKIDYVTKFKFLGLILDGPHLN